LNHPERILVNKIVFKNKRGGLFCNGPPKYPEIVGPKRINSYKISPLTVKKSKEPKEARKNESLKTGIRQPFISAQGMKPKKYLRLRV
jgi:hypothetical protein